MKSYERFIFESFSLIPGEQLIELKYSLDDQVIFTEKLTLPPSLDLTKPTAELNAALFALHLAGGASYYKLYLPKNIEVRSGQLTSRQAQFWNDLYLNGLGEFFYRNKINFHGLIDFPVTAKDTPQNHISVSTPKNALVPFGGGKDSIVTSSLLKKSQIAQTLFRVRSHTLITAMAKTAELPMIEIERTLDSQLAELSTAGAYNGHVPITAYISFLAVTIALLGGYDAVIFSNERSSSYGNIEYLGLQVNHQWSKSLEAETWIRSYVQQYITPSVQYLNPLRSLSELKIAQLFANQPEFFPYATSCNRNWTLTKTMPDGERWCGDCPKCAFSFALLSAFLPLSQVTDIFGQNLFENPRLLPLYRELWGEEGFKPFECVGTPEETAAALYLASLNPDYSQTPVIKAFSATVLPQMEDPASLASDLLRPEASL